MTKPLRQTLLPFKCEMMDRNDTLTGFGGLPPLHEMMIALGLPRFVRRTLTLKGKGWEEWRLLESVIGTIAELGIVIADEFRDGNVAPAHDVLGFFKRCLSVIPKGVKRIRTRVGRDRLGERKRITGGYAEANVSLSRHQKDAGSNGSSFRMKP